MRVQPVVCLLLATLWTSAQGQIRRKTGDDLLPADNREPAHLPYGVVPPGAGAANSRDRPPSQVESLRQRLQQQVPEQQQQQLVLDHSKNGPAQRVQMKSGPHSQKDQRADNEPPSQPLDQQLGSAGRREGAGAGAVNQAVGGDNQGAGASNVDGSFRAGLPRHKGQQQHMDSIMKKRAEEQRAAQEQVFRQQEELRQQQQARVRQQQDAIRKKTEEEQQKNNQLLFQQQRQQNPAGALNDNNNNNGVNANGANVGDNRNVRGSADNQDVNRFDQVPPKRQGTNFPVPTKLVVPTPRPPVPPRDSADMVVNQQAVGGAGSLVGDNVPKPRDDQGTGNRFPDDAHPDNNNNNGLDEVPDAPNPKPPNIIQNVNNPQNPAMSDEFRRGIIKKVQGPEESNQNQQPFQQSQQEHAFPPEQPVREVGGMDISWDWDDFSITFQNYGAAEMKVRRAPHATTGEPWPLPQYYTKKNTILTVDPNFQFVVAANRTCDIIKKAIERYKARIVNDAMEDMYDNLQNAEGSNVEEPHAKYKTPLYTGAPTIRKFSVKIRKPCTKIPNLQSDESYDLVVKKSAAYLWANEVWGLLRGLETLSQIIWKGPDGKLYVKESIISDYPRFAHRGILLDSSRHFIFKDVIFDMMDAMEMNKMNVLHWHIVDDQSFPYASAVFPELSRKGAYHPTFVYSLQDIAEIIEYGRMRGIRILPEFDSPGHTYSWGLSRPDLLTQCFSGHSQVHGYLGPIDPVRNSTYKFLKTLFDEILHVFKDDFMHLGGDEVPLGCWQSNPTVKKFGDKLSAQHGMDVQDDSQAYFGQASPSIRLVYEYYVNRLMKDIKDLGKKRANDIKFIMWQEVMNNDLKLPNDTLIQVWMGDMADVSRAISLGYNVLYSTCWYLDHIEYGVKWPKYYQCDPVDGTYGYNIDENKVKGGEACLWSEYIDNENLIQVTWPRASAVAERLWSSKDTRDLDLAGKRLSEHRCRMLRRGLAVGQISGPDYCQKRGVNRRRGCSGCQGNDNDNHASAREVAPPYVPPPVGKSTDCSWLVQFGGNVTVLAIVAVIALFLLVSLTRNHGKLYQLRQCRHRTILIVFLGVLLIYFMCYTTISMHVFDFQKRRTVS